MPMDRLENPVRHFKLEFSALKSRYVAWSRFRLTNARIGAVFLGAWYLVLVLLAVLGSPELRSGPNKYLLLFVISTMFATVVLGFLLCLAILPSWYGSVPQTADDPDHRSGDAVRINLNRLFFVMLFIVVAGGVIDLYKGSTKNLPSSMPEVSAMP
jgi:hypothetical protein